MSGRWTRALTVAAAMVAIVLGGQLILETTPLELHRTITPTQRLIGLAVHAVWVAAVVISMVRQPTSQLWKVILLWTLVGQIWLISYLPLEPRVLKVLPGYLFGDLWVAVFIHLALAYPSGRLLDRFDRSFVSFLYAFVIGFRLFGLALQREDCSLLCGDPIPFIPSELSWEMVVNIALAILVICLTLTLVELARHWHKAGPGGRRTITPMLVAASLWCATTFAGYFADRFLDHAAQDATHTWNPFNLTQELVIPVAVILGALQARLARGNVADLAVQLGRGVSVGGLRDVLARAMRDPSLQLAFPAPEGVGLVDAEGRPMADPASAGSARAVTRVEHNGQLLALLIDDPAAVEEDPGLAEAVGSVARLALENERLAAQVRAQLEEVRASRQRIVDAADAERRRVERDLHDGAQQRLVALAMRLDLARETTGASTQVLDDATTELRAAVAEVRNLARGLHPTILTEAGLRPAIEALAERAAIPFTVDVPDRRFPPIVEAAAYFVVNEAVTNTTKYAAATGIRVSIREEGGRLAVAIRDDGHGGADPGAGSGLRGLMDRVAALGGRLDVDSPPGGGTTIVADLPLAI